MTTEKNRVEIPDRIFFRIGDVAEIVGLKTYVLRYWETEFPVISPQKSATGQRVYRRSDVETLLMIKHLLYEERYSIEGARKRINELRKEGELKSFKQETVSAQVAAPVLSARTLEQIKQAALEVKLLTQTPLGKLFPG